MNPIGGLHGCVSFDCMPILAAHDSVTLQLGGGADAEKEAVAEEEAVKEAQGGGRGRGGRGRVRAGHTGRGPAFVCVDVFVMSCR